MAETDLISRQAAIDAIENTEWYHQNANKDMVSGANPDMHQAWYKAEDVYRALESVPPAQPEQDIEHCETCIHRTDSVDICILRKCKYAIAESIDCYEPKQPERKKEDEF